MRQGCGTSKTRPAGARTLSISPRKQVRDTSSNTLGLRCARFARWPPQARERGSSGRASDTASPGWRRALAAS